MTCEQRQKLESSTSRTAVCTREAQTGLHFSKLPVWSADPVREALL